MPLFEPREESMILSAGPHIIRLLKSQGSSRLDISVHILSRARGSDNHGSFGGMKYAVTIFSFFFFSDLRSYFRIYNRISGCGVP